MKNLLLLLFTCLLAPALSVAQSMETYQRSVTVSGEGTVQAVPDKATVRFGIATRSEDPEDARSRNATTASNTMNAIRAMGIDERKLQLQTLRLQPYNTYNPETRRNEEKGYEAYRDLMVEVEDLELLPRLIAEVVQMGANRLNSVNYGLKDDQAVRNEALAEAVVQARAKAELMATTLGATLGRVLVIQEEGLSMPMPVMRMEMADARMLKAEAAPEPDAYAAGEMDVRASVRITFALED